jgi:hypothetical protein
LRKTLAVFAVKSPIILIKNQFTSYLNSYYFYRQMLTNTNHTLEKLETLLRVTGYRVRYEKGNFKTGACVLLNSKVVVVNKFSGLEAKILAIAELARSLEMDETLLDEKQAALLAYLKQTKLEF